ncbi:restriction endonuclease subunit S [Listeria monocytogenes]|nr:restriction endonuclease subunit S [Listeria monocytogenes]EKZ0268198.1 restriction endonuclease subunit S [Listeria monocytogenes]EKZ0268456.1 restriction endonuclease subunit S [Listeria monocytogenes]
MSFSKWREAKIGDLCTIKGGKRLPKGRNLTINKTKHPYIRIRDMYQHKYIEENGELEYVDDQTFELIKRYIVDSGDIILAIVGNTIGLVSLIGKSLNKASLTENCVKLIDMKSVKPEFIYYYLITEAGQNEIKSKIVGTSQPKLPIYGVQDIKIPVPPLKEQEEMVAILSSLDDKIKVNSQINKTLGDMAQAIFKQWFVDFEFPNEYGEPYKSSGGEMVESELGMIPKEWDIVELSNIVSENRRGFAPSYSKNDIGIPVINQRCIRNHTIIEEAVKYHDNEVKKVSEDFFLKPFDVLINSMGVGTLGRVSQVSIVEQEQIVHSCITILRSNKDVVDPIILGHMIKNLESVIEVMGTGSTGQTSLNNKDLGMLKVVLPPISIQNEISILLTKLLITIDQNNIENKKLGQIRDLLLPKLMSGEIRVPLDEEGEVS